VLAGLVRALRLSEAERDHLHHLAGAPAGPAPGPPREVRQSILDLLDRLPQAAATVTSAMFEVIAWNDLAAALMEDFSALPRRHRNLARRLFLGPNPQGRRLYGRTPGRERGVRPAVGLPRRGRRAHPEQDLPAPSEVALRLLSVIGTQRLDISG